jgi:hypothetical protein
MAYSAEELYNETFTWKEIHWPFVKPRDNSVYAWNLKMKEVRPGLPPQHTMKQLLEYDRIISII